LLGEIGFRMKSWTEQKKKGGEKAFIHSLFSKSDSKKRKSFKHRMGKKKVSNQSFIS
jgi:hypothetical protein